MAEAGVRERIDAGDAIDASVPGVLRMPLRLLSPAGRRGRLTVLMFHRVHAEPDPLFPRSGDARLFRARMQWLRELFNVLPLDEAIRGLARRALPERAAAITFDDGYADNATVALPILRELGLTATFFVTTGCLGGGRMWNDTVIELVRRAPAPQLDATAADLGVHPIDDHASRRKAIATLIRALKYLPDAERSARVATLASLVAQPLPNDLMMTPAQVRELASAGMCIGAHTVSHPILTRLDSARAMQEIGQSREALEGIVGRKVTLFAYPNGKPDDDYAREHVDIVRRCGFEAAFTTAAGAARAGDACYELPRFTPWDRTGLRFGLRLLRNLRTPIGRAAA